MFLVPELFQLEQRPHRIAHQRRLEKAAALLNKNKTIQTLALRGCAQCRQCREQEPVRQRLAEMAFLGVFDVIVNGMHVAGHPGEEQEVRIGERLGGPTKGVADL